MASRTEINSESALVHHLDLNEYGLDEVPSNLIEEAKNDVADYLSNEVLRFLDAGVSPVRGEGRFKRVDAEYAQDEKSGVRTANLELEGDLKDSLIAEPEAGSFIAFGHRGGEVPKADGHNQLSTKAKRWANEIDFPRRRYIPDNSQKFESTITNGISRIIEGYKSNEVSSLDDLDLFAGSGTTTDVTTGITTSVGQDLFDDDVIDLLLTDAFNRRV